MNAFTLSLSGICMPSSQKFTRFTRFTRLYLLFLSFLAPLSFLTAQTDPCSINVGETIEICFDDASFELNGLLGSNVDPTTVHWSTNAAGFDIDDPNDPNSTVTPDPMGGNFPTGTFTFSLSATCIGGQQLLDFVQIVVETGASQAVILANGQDVPEITVCTEVELTHQSIGADETGCWSYFFTNSNVTVEQGGCSDVLIARVDPRNYNPCLTLWFYYTVENGGCVTKDSVKVEFIGQDENVRFTNLTDDAGYCTDDIVRISGSAIGCSGNSTLHIIEYPLTPPVILNTNIFFTVVQFEVQIFETGWYTFVYEVDPIPGTYGCAGGLDTVRVFYCLSDPEISSEIYRECGIPDEADLVSPYNPNYIYGDWYWSVNPNTVTDPVITYPNPSNPSVAVATINDAEDIDQIVFQQNIIVDSCFIEREMEMTFPCPGGLVFDFDYFDLVTGETMTITLLTIECDGDSPSIIVADGRYIEGVQITGIPDCTESSMVCYYTVKFIWKQPNPCYVTTTYIFNVEPEVKDTTVNLLCGGDPAFMPWDYYPELTNGSFTLKVLQVPANHPSLTVGQMINNLSATLNLLPLGIYQFEMEQRQGACSDTGILIVHVDDISEPVAPVVADFCVGEIVELVGSIPDNPAAQILWTQLDMNPPLVFFDPPTITNPSITATDPGIYILEYSFSKEDDCYLADTVTFEVTPCDTSNCLITMIDSIQCYDNGTADPSDDYWTFSLFVDHPTGGTFWNASAPVSQSGPYGQWKTIWMGAISGFGSTISFTVSDDAATDTCTAELVVDVPPPCSDTCALDVVLEVGDCHDNDTPTDPSDDYYKVSITVTGTNGECWMAKRKNLDGSEELLGSFTGDQTVTLGPFDIADGDWTLWVFICDQFDCLVDFYIQPPDVCSSCHQVQIANVQCLNGGTATTADDQWVFDILVNGGIGTYFDLTAPVPAGQSGSYGVWKTIWMGNILSYGSSVSFDVVDNLDSSCRTPVTLNVPITCSAPCELTTSVSISDCKKLDGQNYYYLVLTVQGSSGGCWMAKRKNADGSETVLVTYYGDQTVILGPF
ncbi:MAG: hypothetical protein KDC44_04700, partial [Phaeodactylibacter sp.]|nr:hypothetical protein [Phaeodactylibacter sp.]